jgi:uncharacterized protein
MPLSPVEADDRGVRLFVRLTPRGGRDAFEGIDILSDGRAVMKARVRAAPDRGAANLALIALFASEFGVPKSAVSLIAGGTGRLKTLRIEGSPDHLVAVARGLATPGGGLKRRA